MSPPTRRTYRDILAARINDAKTPAERTRLAGIYLDEFGEQYRAPGTVVQPMDLTPGTGYYLPVAPPTESPTEEPR